MTETKLILGPSESHVFKSGHDLLSLGTLKSLVEDPDSVVGEPFWFGLGFAKIRLNTMHVLNFWTGGGSLKLLNPVPELHTHRYGFTSEVLRGELISTVYDAGRFLAEGTHILETVTCSPDGSEMPDRPIMGRCTPQELQRTQHGAGTSYHIWQGAYHFSYATRPTVTLLERPPTYEVAVAKVLRPVDKPPECLFAQPGSIDPWPVIERVLNAPIGYHNRPIPKGTLGEASKIEEELMEFVDAVDRPVRNPVLELCELADGVGAIKAYLAEKYPGMTFQDLEEMARATKESFQKGDRR